MVLLGSGNGLQNGVADQFSGDAVNSLWLWTGRTSIPFEGMKKGRPIRLTDEDHTFLRDKVDGIVELSSRFYLPGNMVYSYGNEYGTFSTHAIHPSMQIVDGHKILEGRYINDIDIQNHRKVIVIGDGVKKALFKKNEPIGKYIKINKTLFKVVGVYTEGNDREQSTSLIPVTTGQRIFNGGNRVHSFGMSTKMVNSHEEAEKITQNIREAMAERHKFDPKDKRAMGTFNKLETFLRTMKIFQAIKMFIWVIGVFTLIAGIIGVSNIMLITVKERTREIGIRKSLGATPGSVISLILMESVLITTVAGYIGLVLGVSIMELVSYLLEQRVSAGGEAFFFKNPTVSFGIAINATILLIISGALAGYIPARKAAKVKPIEALRDE
jgi:putative ABC transport system permease protein